MSLIAPLFHYPWFCYFLLYFFVCTFFGCFIFDDLWWWWFFVFCMILFAPHWLLISKTDLPWWWFFIFVCVSLRVFDCFNVWWLFIMVFVCVLIGLVCVLFIDSFVDCFYGDYLSLFVSLRTSSIFIICVWLLMMIISCALFDYVCMSLIVLVLMAFDDDANLLFVWLCLHVFVCSLLITFGGGD